MQIELKEEVGVDALVAELDAKLHRWNPAPPAQVRQRVAAVIELADRDVLELMRSRATEKDVLDLLDESETQ